MSLPIYLGREAASPASAYIGCAPAELGPRSNELLSHTHFLLLSLKWPTKKIPMAFQTSITKFW